MLEGKPNNDKRDSSLTLQDEIISSIQEKMEALGDALGKQIDKGIFEVVVFAEANGLPTSGSCEGHIGWGLPTPWLDIKADGQPEERFIGQEEIEKNIARKYGLTIDELKASKIDDAFWESVVESSKNEETDEYKKWKEKNDRVIQKTKVLLDEFYKNRETDVDVKLIISKFGDDGFRIKSGCFEYDPPSNDKSKMSEEEKNKLAPYLARRQNEMRAFSDFLRDKFFTSELKRKR